MINNNWLVITHNGQMPAPDGNGKRVGYIVDGFTILIGETLGHLLTRYNAPATPAASKKPLIAYAKLPIVSFSYCPLCHEWLRNYDAPLTETDMGLKPIITCECGALVRPR